MDDLKKKLYDAALITAGAAAVGYASRKAVGTPLGTLETLKGALKLGTAVGLGWFAVKYAKEKIWIPSEITK